MVCKWYVNPPTLGVPEPPQGEVYLPLPPPALGPRRGPDLEILKILVFYSVLAF